MPIVFVNGPFHRRAMRKVGWICGRDPVRSPCLERCDNLIGDANDGAVEYGRGRELLTPERAFGIDGGQIPKNSIRKTTIRLRLRLAGVSGHPIRDETFLIPKLPRALVRQPAERGTRWSSEPVHRQDRLPNDEHCQVCIRMLLQHLFGCGGPPQTTRSSGRQQQNDARLIRGVVELLPEGSQGFVG